MMSPDGTRLLAMTLLNVYQGDPSVGIYAIDPVFA